MKDQEDFKEFVNQFVFKQKNFLKIGVEREYFLADENGQIVPRAPEMLEFLDNPERFTPELPACQLESNFGPAENLFQLMLGLEQNEHFLKIAEKELGIKRLYCPVAPPDIPLEIFPSKRYQKIAKSLSPEKLLAGCRIIGTHIHIGMPDKYTGLQVFNQVVGSCQRLIKIGNSRSSSRLQIYKIVNPNFMPRQYNGWRELFSDAKRRGFSQDIQCWWDLIRLTRYGTIEFRMFGPCEDIRQIVHWAGICLELCAIALLN